MEVIGGCRGKKDKKARRSSTLPRGVHLDGDDKKMILDEIQRNKQRMVQLSNEVFTFREQLLGLDHRLNDLSFHNENKKDEIAEEVHETISTFTDQIKNLTEHLENQKNEMLGTLMKVQLATDKKIADSEKKNEEMIAENKRMNDKMMADMEKKITPANSPSITSRRLSNLARRSVERKSATATKKTEASKKRVIKH